MRKIKKRTTAALTNFQNLGVNIRPFPTQITKALKRKWNTVAKEESRKDRDFSIVNRAYQRFLKDNADTEETNGALARKFRGRTSEQVKAKTHPGSAGYWANDGEIRGQLRSIRGADQMLTLQKQNVETSRWQTVARSSTAGNRESVTYNATAGMYRWSVRNKPAAGRYSLASTRF